MLKRKTFFAFLTVTVFFVAGCSSISGHSATEYSGKFSGNPSSPHYAEIKDLYDKSPESWAKKILEDGKITDEEFFESRKYQDDCYMQYNAKVSYDEYGYITVENLSKDKPTKSLGSVCNTGGLFIPTLYFIIKSNPDDSDIYELQRKCAIEVGLAPKEMVLDDLMKMYENHAFSWDANNIRWERCAKDPLGTVSSWKK
ncbi:MAG: hypothetical protein LBI63_06165 [Candidatus Ancillula sp.]|jgi:hypothetical protein|nr:hypothetical protein [Candidatus Ancillula sp.]